MFAKLKARALSALSAVKNRVAGILRSLRGRLAKTIAGVLLAGALALGPCASQAGIPEGRLAWESAVGAFIVAADEASAACAAGRIEPLQCNSLARVAKQGFDFVTQIEEARAPFPDGVPLGKAADVLAKGTAILRSALPGEDA